ncbi:MAG: hypothetical protein Fur005_02050 [Roseiflexaceae bacterium]
MQPSYVVLKYDLIIQTVLLSIPMLCEKGDPATARRVTVAREGGGIEGESGRAEDRLPSGRGRGILMRIGDEAEEYLRILPQRAGDSVSRRVG